MTLHGILSEARADIVDQAVTDLHLLDLEHYAAAGDTFARERFEALYDLVLSAIDGRDLSSVIEFATQVADERFKAGFDLFEVQTAFNSLEALTWRHVVGHVEPSQLAEYVGLVGTVFGMAKDTLARRYVSLAADRHVPTLDLTALFTGTSSVVPYIS